MRGRQGLEQGVSSRDERTRGFPARPKRNERTGPRCFVAAFLLALILGIGISPLARAEAVAWTRQFGSTGDDSAVGVFTDSSGTYVAGWVYGALPGQSYLGAGDAFVRKYDPLGNEVWTIEFGTPLGDVARGVWVDSTGVYVAGDTQGILQTPGMGGYTDAFLQKYGLNGGPPLWTVQFGTPGWDIVTEISGNSDGIYVSGWTNAAFPGQTYLGGDLDAFIALYSRDGNKIWERQVGTSVMDWGETVSACGDSGAFIGGMTTGAFPGFTNLGWTDAFVLRYNVDGTVAWLQQFGTPQVDSIEDSDAYGVSGLVLVGYTDGELPNQVSSGSRDAFVQRRDVTDGAEVWTRQFGTAANDEGHGVSSDGTSVNVAGDTAGEFPYYVNAGSTDIFARRFGIYDSMEWTNQFGTSGTDTVWDAALNPPQGLYVVGDARGAFPGQTSQGLRDAYVSRVGGRGLAVEVTGGLDYKLNEDIWSVTALVKDAYDGTPLEAAVVTMDLYFYQDMAPFPPTPVFVLSAPMLPMLGVPGVYWWDVRNAVVPNLVGDFVAVIDASFNGGPVTTAIVEFHVDPPGGSHAASFAWQEPVAVASLGVLLGVAFAGRKGIARGFRRLRDPNGRCRGD